MFKAVFNHQISPIFNYPTICGTRLEGKNSPQALNIGLKKSSKMVLFRIDAIKKFRSFEILGKAVPKFETKQGWKECEVIILPKITLKGVLRRKYL